MQAVGVFGMPTLIRYRYAKVQFGWYGLPNTLKHFYKAKQTKMVTFRLNPRGGDRKILKYRW